MYVKRSRLGACCSWSLPRHPAVSSGSGCEGAGASSDILLCQFLPGQVLHQVERVQSHRMKQSARKTKTQRPTRPEPEVGLSCLSSAAAAYLDPEDDLPLAALVGTRRFQECSELSSQQMTKKSRAWTRGTAPPLLGSTEWSSDKDTLALQGQKQCQDTKRPREPRSLNSFSLAPGANECENCQCATQCVHMRQFSHVSLHVQIQTPDA